LNLNGVDLGDAGAYVAVHFDLPPGGPQLTSDQRFEGTKQGVLAMTPGSKFVSESNITLNGKHPGREMKFEVNGKFTVTLRVYLVENRGYQLIAGGPGASAADVKKFLDSFKLTGA